MARSPTRETIKIENVFLSWSGERSLYVAKFFRDWLPKVLQRAKPWLSAVDIDKGSVGLDEIKKALAGMKIGIFFLTPENRGSLWIPYEAGGLANEVDDRNRVCPYLLADLQIQHVNGPLGNFQRTMPEKEETRKLVHTINRAIGEEVVPDLNLDAIFEKMWPDLESHLAQMPKAEEIPKPYPPPEQMIAEILELTRAAANSRKQAEWLDQLTVEFKGFFPAFLQLLKGANLQQHIQQLAVPPAPPPPPPPREPLATFCVKLAGIDEIKRVQGTAAVEVATGQVAVLVGSDMVAKFERVEGWWRETPDGLPKGRPLLTEQEPTHGSKEKGPSRKKGISHKNKQG